jgi:6-phosphogluconolactonase
MIAPFIALTATLAAVAFTSVAAIPESELMKPETAEKLFVYVGTYTNRGSKGIYQLEMDPKTGKLEQVGVTENISNPSFVAIHPNGKYLYSVNEVGELAGKKGGAVTAFAIDPISGSLKMLNQQSTGGAGPCHVSVDPRGEFVMCANYGGGSVSMHPIRNDGSLGDRGAFVQHGGSSVDKSRQEGPHAHSINADSAGRFAVAADLGLDSLIVYRIDRANDSLASNDPPAARVAPGSGPRHFAFHPNGKRAYVINEMLCTVTAFNYDANKGTLTEIQTISTLPDGVKPGYSTAEILVHPSGKFVYGSNRGHHSIAMFAVDSDSGKLTFLGTESTQGKTPRNFGIDPSGQYLLAANQDSNNIVVFKIDQKTGRLTPTGHSIEIPTPVCVRFLRL